MKRILKFTRNPELTDLEGLQINGASFKQGKGIYTSVNTIVMNIPDVFRFNTQLEVAHNAEGEAFLITSQFLSRWAEMWEMEEGFSRIGFKNPEIEQQMRELCETLISRGLAEWIEETKQYLDKNGKLIEVDMVLKNDAGEIRTVYMFGSDNELGFNEGVDSARVIYKVDNVEYFPLYQFDLDQWEIVTV